ncbi:transcription factor Tfb4 [Trichoderma longibrachiatum ATCC 18648]|uniref:General transcription and DNA repair factor IIH subunit TFB4 n=1 Tax=Trichoderma longibrachiatum ATCC 18648 TaxID=983965 RepID=A0A2T4BQS6_TRILO|nr:transcription factor Tfb4 [Trichoderma longibrachiatum ATCC 18648]
MDAVDVSEHYEVTAADNSPSLLSIVLDTNPRAWAALDSSISLAQAICDILVFANAHLAFSNTNQVAVIAAHVNRAVWLYPAAPRQQPSSSTTTSKDHSGDVQMQDVSTEANAPPPSANKYPQFAQIESSVFSSIQTLMAETTVQDLDQLTTHLSGALTLALCRINKAAQALSSSDTTLSNAAPVNATAPPPVKGRIVVVSVSDSDPSQYIPTMNAVFAAAHNQVAIDTIALAGDSTFLQQACFNTNGIFLRAANPRGLLTYLMVVDTGYVCSVCLSIFCSPPNNAECLTCGTVLALGNYGAKPAVLPRKKKKKKKIANGSGREETGSATGTPRP